MFTKEQVEAWSKAEEEAACKHCGRVVLCGPVCCYDRLHEMYLQVLSERDWLRKIQSRKDKKIHQLQQELAAVQAAPLFVGDTHR